MAQSVVMILFSAAFQSNPQMPRLSLLSSPLPPSGDLSTREWGGGFGELWRSLSRSRCRMSRNETPPFPKHLARIAGGASGLQQRGRWGGLWTILKLTNGWRKCRFATPRTDPAWHGSDVSAESTGSRFTATRRRAGTRGRSWHFVARVLEI